MTEKDQVQKFLDIESNELDKFKKYRYRIIDKSKKINFIC